ncbi:MAG: sulfurtransferase [Burkholderiales bacterium]
MHKTLISAAELAAHANDPQWIVFDCRHDLADTGAGRRAYAQAHIPGAHFLHLDDDLSAARTGANGRHPLPDPQVFCARLGALGLASGMQAVAYDAHGGVYASRLWWMLRWVGHDAVTVLDGGLGAWQQAGYPVTAAASAPRPARFTGTPRPLAVDAAFVAAHLDDGEMRLIDARAHDRFRGENETLDPVGGHIPGAVNRFFRDNLAADGRFKPAAALRAEFATLLGGTNAAQVVQQCGSGVTACHNLLAMEAAGLTGSRLYPGSWSEWCADPARPVAR